MFALFTRYESGTDVTLLNTGYADLKESEGLFIDNQYRQTLDRYRIQLYDHVVVRNGGIENMRDKTLLETGCGRGGGLNYIVQKMRPRSAVGVDICGAQVPQSSVSSMNIGCLLQETLALWSRRKHQLHSYGRGKTFFCCSKIVS